MNCRHCGKPLPAPFLDLGYAPPSNAYLNAEDLSKPEVHYPLRLRVCASCWLVQTEDYASAGELFSADYAYFSSTSASWCRHAETFATRMIAELGLHGGSHVIEVASNDGYLLRHMVAGGIPCLGIEPTASTAAAAEKLGVPVLREFFGQSLAETLAQTGQQADLIIGNNVYAHVPDINDFTRGLCTALKPEGMVSLEFPHLMRLLEQCQFDTVYHEHYSYLSLQVVQRIFAGAGLRVFDVEELPTHGGSLRVFGCHETDPRPTSDRVQGIVSAEREAGLERHDTYAVFQARAERIKLDLLDFLVTEKRAGRAVAAYGAAAKGNTLLNFAGVKPDLLPYVCDAAPSKQGKFLPGSHIPIVTPGVLQERCPERVLILPWNIAAEIKEQLAESLRHDCRFVTAVPQLDIR